MGPIFHLLIDRGLLHDPVTGRMKFAEEASTDPLRSWSSRSSIDTDVAATKTTTDGNDDRVNIYINSYLIDLSPFRRPRPLARNDSRRATPPPAVDSTTRHDDIGGDEAITGRLGCTNLQPPVAPSTATPSRQLGDGPTANPGVRGGNNTPDLGDTRRTRRVREFDGEAALRCRCCRRR